MNLLNGYREPPDDLDDDAQRLWVSTIAQLIRQGSWQPSDLPTCERYVRAVALARAARDAMAGSLTAEGSPGQPVAHPSLKTLRDAELDAHRFAGDLLLTPASRIRAGFPASGLDETNPFIWDDNDERDSR
jgi:P27 family predicted phage terminase small subunit